MAIVRQCRMCGVEYDAGDLPALCPICVDERQYLAEDRRQHWVDPMDFTGRISVIEPEPGLTEPPAAITDEAVTAVRALGPLRAVIASHPHMYGLQSMWAREFDAE